jgi:hypothetical protein
MGDTTDENDEIASAPETATTAATDAPATAVVTHVDQAVQGAQSQAESTGEQGWNVVAGELKGLRSDIKKLLKSRSESATSTTTGGAAANTPEQPIVEVEQPTPPKRTVRRNGRKVKR